MSRQVSSRRAGESRGSQAMMSGRRVDLEVRWSQVEVFTLLSLDKLINLLSFPLLIHKMTIIRPVSKGECETDFI